jgi:hypothetical protein
MLQKNAVVARMMVELSLRLMSWGNRRCISVIALRWMCGARGNSLGRDSGQHIAAERSPLRTWRAVELCTPGRVVSLTVIHADGGKEAARTIRN